MNLDNASVVLDPSCCPQEKNFYWKSLNLNSFFQARELDQAVLVG